MSSTLDMRSLNRWTAPSSMGVSMMLRDGNAARSPSEGPTNKSRLCLCSLNTFRSSVLVCIAFLCESWHCSSSLTKSSFFDRHVIGPRSASSSFSLFLSSSSILARVSKRSSTLEPILVSSSMLSSASFKFPSVLRELLFCLIASGRTSYPSGSNKSSMCRSLRALLKS